MDAASLTPESARELAELRRRAYGPRADIAEDARAVARLGELEALVRTSSAVGSTPRPEPASALTASSSPPAASRSAPVSDGAPPVIVTRATATPAGAVPDGDEAAAPASARTPSAATRPSWWRRIPAWALVGAGVVAGVAAGAGGAALSSPQPDLTLRVAPDGGDRGPDWGSELSSWGLDPSSAVPYEEYDGVGVWLLRNDEGSSCIVLEDDGRPVTAGCASGGLDPVLDVTTYVEAEELFDAERPVGSVTRFIGRGSVVEVWERIGQSSADVTSRSDSLPSAP